MHTSADVEKSRVLISARKTIRIGVSKDVEAVVDGYNNHILLVAYNMGAGPESYCGGTQREATAVDPEKNSVSGSTT